MLFNNYIKNFIQFCLFRIVKYYPRFIDNKFQELTENDNTFYYKRF